jgi:hypothetical protein
MYIYTDVFGGFAYLGIIEGIFFIGMAKNKIYGSNGNIYELGFWVLVDITVIQSLLHAVADLRGRLEWALSAHAQCSSRGQVIFSWASGWMIFTAIWLALEVVWTLLPPRCRTNSCPTLL